MDNCCLLTFFMGYVPVEGRIRWVPPVLQRACDNIPKFLALYHSMGNIAAARAVFPEARLHLDDWHLSKNQMLNVRNLCGLVTTPFTMTVALNDLHVLRQSSTEEKFLERRLAFGKNYIWS